MAAIDIKALAAKLSTSSGIAAKQDIGAIAARLGLQGQQIAVGDDCAALPDGDGYLLFAIEGFMNEFVAADPWFAGWCGVMVNISDVVAMGGRPIAVVDAVWANGEAGATPVLEGMRAASSAFGVPIVGGHTNIRSERGQLSVAILGRAKTLLTSFDAKPGDVLVAAIDHRGRYREPFNNWEAATDAAPARLRGDLKLLPEIAEAGLALSAKDISQGGIVGTAIMLAECSHVGIDIDVTAIPLPAGVSLDRWLVTFPSFGYLLSVAPEDVADVVTRFTARGISAAVIGAVVAGAEVALVDGERRAVVRNHAETPLLQLGRQDVAA
ncbi:sll0787 family AIR synthase-like protein [Rhizobium ruizarguesonis]|jgi:AIR synthase-related protein|uniref:sll0787 family AIR synthase-like protein n=1 Tax=Rhizobium ruizarguesonis TaxID=2081791 RepID=UPI00037FC873|nr:sll0787 family AIR synthase-like protein [Rhizobium ruizarguesonis]MBY5829993.1 sll0787 family AIR synthase-like protein [Rhizobium leguminosarum]QJS26076.1 sll0787 family AIR synthase-like protein [Rhizobium leguminosarum bv. trifolii TA1]TBY69029.1 sll0787 family AIR synthase-like protein [Rhizobium leguminosarum bv. viciae]MBY5854883.1 sll0787 family AIR synthase-like protein [Rhizobium leguminosarum]MBY5858665.1 sll0787 family AIR synthase-like protein [Rhizobium leguminosarum]